jgi:hypothetical protein
MDGKRMSVNATHYVMIAAKFDFREFDQAAGGGDRIEEAFDGYLDNGYVKKVTSKNGFTLIEDGMNGEYTFFGKVLSKSLDGMPITDCCQNINLDESRLQIVAELEKLGINLPVNVSVYAFTHYH